MPSTTVESLIAEVEESLARLLQLPDEDKRRKLSDMQSMIERYTGLTDQIEERRNKNYEFTLLYAAVLVPVIALMTAKAGALAGVPFIGGGLAVAALGALYIQLAFAFASIALFTFQSRFKYPFLDLDEYANQWKWFYYGNPEIQDISVSTMFPATDENRTVIPYLKGLRFFVDRYTEEDTDRALRAAVVQLHLLQVHNYYKNKWYTRLYGISRTSVIVTMIWLLAAPAVWAVCVIVSH